MDQPITDYRAFLTEAWQAVTELNEMQQREGALSQQLNQSRKQLEAEEKIIDVKLSQVGQQMKISVFNTGSPIPEESIEHIWEKFYKVDKARTREYGGSGIGLSIVKAIMESMNQQYGVINYENGVEFWFTLDLA